MLRREGFDAVDLDNLDSFTRSRGLLDLEDDARPGERAGPGGARPRARPRAEERRRAPRRVPARCFDFALVEECAPYDECAAYLDAYDRHVYAVEYTDAQDETFGEACERWGGRIGLTLRDRDLQPAGDAAHVEEPCG